jgi:ParB/RepB/Spo0J family partition protein
MAENPARPAVVKVVYEHSRTAAWVARARVLGLALEAAADQSISSHDAPAAEGAARTAPSGGQNHDTEVKTVEQRMIPTDRIRILEGHNARWDIGDLTELQTSIEELGVLQPLTVVELGARDGESMYGLVAGERRLTAARQAGLAEVPCVVHDLDERRRVAAMLVENLQRKDLTALEEAAGFKRLAAMGQSQREIARQLGRSQGHVSKRLALLDLPADIRLAIEQGDAGGITVADALELVKLAEHPKRQAAAFDQRESYGGVTGAVRRHLDVLKREQAKESARAQLRQAGVELLKEHDSYINWRIRKEKPLHGQGRMLDYEAIKVTVDEHREQPCHAAVMDSDGQVVYVCREPDRHMDADPTMAAKIQEQREEKAQRRATNKLQREATAARRPALDTVLAAANTSHLPFAALQVLSLRGHQNIAEAACRLLGLRARPSKYGWTDYAALLGKYAGQNLGAATRALMAMALACGEERVDGPYGAGDEFSQRHMQLLVAAGYMPNEFDGRHLGVRDGDDEGAELATCRVCGCTDEESCEGGCGWVRDPEELGDLCSRCLPKVQENQRAPAAVGD